MKSLVKMRTLDEAYAELKQMDSGTAVTKHFIRQLAITGRIPTVMCGRKRLINFDGLLDYLENPTAEKFQVKPDNNAAVKGIRKVY